MNPVERVLHQELTGLLDRLATSVPEGGFETTRADYTVEQVTSGGERRGMLGRLFGRG